MSAPHPRFFFWVWTRLAPVLGLLSLGFPFHSARAGDRDRLLAVYLPGVLFARLEDKVELGNELASHVAAQLGERYRLTARVYATQEALDADAAHIVLLLAESPLVAARASTLQPLVVAAAGTNTETRVHVLASPALSALADLRGNKLHYALPLDNPALFVENLLFEGELSLPREKLIMARDVSSLLSLASLRKADALLLYEDDLAQGQKAGLRSLYSSAPLPRPTVAASDKHVPSSDIARVRDALTQFRSTNQPTWRSFRPTQEAPYQALRQRQERRPKRLPPLLELDDDAGQLPLPQPPQPPPRVPLSTYAPRL